MHASAPSTHALFRLAYGQTLATVLLQGYLRRAFDELDLRDGVLDVCCECMRYGPAKLTIGRLHVLYLPDIAFLASAKPLALSFSA